MPTQTINLNNTTPAAAAGALNVEWQADPPSLNPATVRNVSACVPAATSAQLGVVQPDGVTVLVSGVGEISIPAATAAKLGLVQPDGATVLISPAGEISIPAATAAKLGLVQPDGATVLVSGAGVISVPAATAGALGVVKPDGSSITVSSGGVISATGSGGGGGGVVPVDAPPSSTTFPPAVSGMIQVNWASRISSFGAGGTGPVTMALTAGAVGVNISALVTTLPPPPYSVRLNASSYLVSSGGILRCMLILRNSASGEMVSIDVNPASSGAVSVIKWNSATSWNSSYTPLAAVFDQNPNALCLKVADDGTNRTWYISPDKGQTFVEALQTPNTDFLVPDQYGFGMDTENSGVYGNMTVYGLTVGTS